MEKKLDVCENSMTEKNFTNQLETGSQTMRSDGERNKHFWATE